MYTAHQRLCVVDTHVELRCGPRNPHREDVSQGVEVVALILFQALALPVKIKGSIRITYSISDPLASRLSVL